MGFNVSWIAVRGVAPEVVHEALGLTPTDEHESFPESETTGTELPSGWYLLHSNGPELDAERLARTTTEQLIACSVYETTMFSMVRGFSHGNEEWSVVHDSGRGTENLDVSGTPPSQFAAIRDEMLAKQRADDTGMVDFVFDVPIRLAEQLTGFAHDGIDDDPERPFRVLERERASPVGWFKRFFGGK